MDSATIERGIAGLEESCARGHDATSLLGEMSDRLQRLVPFDGSLWFATDPATVLATAPARIENVEDGHCETYWEREFRVEDALLFRDLARTDTGVGTLYDVTGGNPGRSARHREFGAPQGYGDELRAALRVGTSTWGVLSLMREAGRAPFGAREVEVIRTIAPVLGDALRMLAVRNAAAVPADLGPGTALYGPDGVLLSLDEPAERLFQELGGPAWLPRTLPMTPVSAVLAQALAVEQGRERGPASARVRAATGRWLSLHASCLRGVDGRPGPVALTIEPAKSAQLAPIIVEAYRLTVREQEITRAVARGLSNPEIAAQLFLSPHTVRDHLKAVFAKVGVGSRGELVATLFADHYAPALHGPGVAVEHVIRG